MYSKEQVKRAKKSAVHKINENDKRIHFKVVFVDSKQEKHEHSVIFRKDRKFPANFDCDCIFCSFYGYSGKEKRLIKLCSNCLAVAKYLNMPEVNDVL